MTDNPTDFQDFRPLAAVLLLVALVFLPSLTFGFVNWDDPDHLLANTLVTDPARASWVEHLTTPKLGYPAPLPVLTYRLEAAAFGLDSAAPFHATNLVLHLAAVACLFVLARRVGLGATGAAVAGVVFGVHPAVAETVSWVSGRKDLLVAVASFACLLLATRDAVWSKRTRWGVFIAFAAALACKPVAAFLVVGIPLIRVAAFGAPERSGWRSEVRAVAPLAALVLVYLPLAVVGQQRLQATAAPEGFAVFARTVWYTLGMHVRLVALAQETCIKYLPAVWPAPFTPSVDLAPLLAAAAFVGGAVTLRTRNRRVFVCAVGLALAAYAPNSNLVPLTRFVADTYVYLPLAGLGIALGAAADALFERLGERAGPYRIALPLVLGVSLALLAVPSSARFRDAYALWQDAQAKNPHDTRVCRAFVTAARLEGGEPRMRQALGVCTRGHGLGPYLDQRARSLAMRGRNAEALACLELAQRRGGADPAVTAAVTELRAAGIRPDRCDGPP